MTTHQHTPAPWTETTAVFIPAGDDRLICNGAPFPVDCRVLCEPNYQLAMRAVNAHDSLTEALRTAKGHIEYLVAVYDVGGAHDELAEINAALALADPPFERMTEEELLAGIEALSGLRPAYVISDEIQADRPVDVRPSISEIEAAENEVHDRLERAFGGLMKLPPVAIDEPGWLDAGYKADREMQRKLELAGLDRITQAGRIRFHEQLREGQGYNDATGFKLRCWMAALRYPFLPAWSSRSAVAK